ncbi:MAG: RluA family pseudouridine synthase [Patescibacteria group bacterium]|nr:RluA family pseudouridine synthase [Patescibacteria group bacterium]MCL5432128.1 RluA family pseudouridine synthase [Patescibacteria group bacterium]
MDIKVIFEDDYLLVVDKPSGLVVNKSETAAGTETMEDWAAGKFIVHRLDKDTSGLLIIAKTPVALENLQAQFKSRTTVKKYLALVHGKVSPQQGSINAPIARSPFNRMHFGVFPGGREATTDYKTISNFKFQISNFSLLELIPHTGRTHQIRVHLKYLGYPIVADPIYGGRKNLQADKRFCPRLFLHATHLEIAHPQTGEILKFDSPLPVDLRKVLDGLQ